MGRSRSTNSRGSGGARAGEGLVWRSIPYARLASQARFHRSRARFKAFCGPVGTGKSLALCQEAIKLAYENPGRLGLIGAPTYPMLRDATERQFFEICVGAGLPHQFHRSENRVTLLDCGSEILFRPLDHFNRLRGPNLAWFGIDELTYCPWEAWEQLQSRLRDPRAARLEGFAAFTPKGFDRAFEFFVASRHGGTDRDLVRADPFENAANLAPGYYDELKRSFDPQLYKQEVLGEFLNIFAGQVYWAFARAQNVKPVEYDPALPLAWSLDFNVDPMCSVIAQWVPPRLGFHPGAPGRPLKIRVLDEIVLAGSSTWQACEEFCTRWAGRHGSLPLLIYGDPAGAARHSVSSKSDWQLIREFFQTTELGRRMRPEFRVLSAAPLVKDRAQAVNARLCSAAGERAIEIDPSCRELIADLERVGWLPGTSQMDKSDPKRTHVSDALGYFVWREWPLRAPAGEREQELI